MDLFDFGSPALQAMSVPAIAVLITLLILTLRSVALGERAMMLRNADPRAESARVEYEKRWRGGLPTS